MPTYSYACTACEHRFDTVQAFTDSSLSECPQCSGRLRKLFGSVGVVFKGSGFYRTDSRAGGSANGSHQDSTSEKSTSSESSGSENSGAKNASTDSGTSKKANSSSSGAAS